ncbi:hypothetical protein DACRYDRAFT_75359 [Dacryopinax primogenitus]|uniref:RBR-type E3 ubiquitin transferase n=1 Tax=Dacryopinax primogenitus (strain DJM 731) TaxID=1858805 RepID=M5GBU4_DACPD|nr:uncharacterized protein DACRYDRAFT_75359 [Dacryopinax primogenitus]EJU05915.1 hypothetical protein DACRYDRAFT_75359 [Dacryopinax primogenitus]
MDRPRIPHYPILPYPQRIDDAARIHPIRPRQGTLRVINHTEPRRKDCAICLDDMTEEDAETLKPCGHPYCRECLKSYVASRLDAGKLPICCPTCVADEAEDPTSISREVADKLGLTGDQARHWDELDLAVFSVEIHCTKCDRSAHVDKAEYNTAQLILCPLPGCFHQWCKACNKTVPFGGPKHDCEGIEELQSLMRQRGWKPCPTCKTNTDKITGCNHIACSAPGCNTHWCYTCGGVIAINPRTPREQHAAVERHYLSSCRLFGTPRDMLFAPGFEFEGFPRRELPMRRPPVHRRGALFTPL